MRRQEHVGRIKVGGICGKNRGGRIMWEKLRKGFLGTREEVRVFGQEWRRYGYMGKR